MNAATIILSIVARLLAVASAVLGFIAEAKKLTPDDISVSGYKCVYPTNPAFTLGICALSLLVAAQAIVSLVGCCPGQGGGAAGGSRRIWGNVCYALSWVAAVIAAALYVVGVVWNEATTRSPEAVGLFFVSCNTLNFPVFKKAALFTLAATALGIFSYTLLRAKAPAATPSTATEQAAGASGPKPDVPPPAPRPHVPPPAAAGEAIAITVNEYYGPVRSNNPPQRYPQCVAQPAYEVVMA